MSELAWVQRRLHVDIAPTGSVSGRIRDAARSLGWSYTRTKDIWYADPRVAVRPVEMRAIETRTGLHYGRKEKNDVDALIARADALLEGADPDFHRPFVAAFRAFAGALDRTGTGRE